MSLVSQLTDLATRIAVEVKAAKNRANHTGTQSADTLVNGTVNQVFIAAEKIKLSSMDYAATANSSDAALRDRSTHTGTQAIDTITETSTGKIMTDVERSKLTTVSMYATQNSPDATLLARGNHTGTQSADTIVDGSTNKVLTSAEKAKLAGIATGATANLPDASLLNRTNHTGSQLASTISDFTTAVQTVGDPRYLQSGMAGSGVVANFLGSTAQPQSTTASLTDLASASSTVYLVQGRRYRISAQCMITAGTTGDYGQVAVLINGAVQAAVVVNIPTGGVNQLAIINEIFTHTSATGTYPIKMQYGRYFGSSTISGRHDIVPPRCSVEDCSLGTDSFNLGLGGLTAEALVSSIQGSISNASMIDVTGMTVNFNAVAGRTYKIECEYLFSGATSNQGVAVQLLNGATVIANDVVALPATSTRYRGEMSANITGNGTVTVKLQAQSTTATTVSANHTATAPGFIRVYDVTPPKPGLTVPRWELTHSTTQSIATGSLVPLIWNTEKSDVGNCHASSDAFITAPVTGVYQCSYSVRFALNATGVRAAWMEREGDLTRYGYNDNAANGGMVSQTGSEAIYLNAGDRVRVYVYQTSGGALNYTDNDSRWSRFSGMMITPPGPQTDLVTTGPLGIVAVGGFAFGDGATVASGGTWANGLSYTTVVGRRYRLVQTVRAVTCGSNMQGYLQPRRNGSSFAATSDRYFQIIGSLGYNSVHAEWIFDGDGVAGTYDSFMQGSASVTAYSGGGHHYLEDLGPTSPIGPSVVPSAQAWMSYNIGWTASPTAPSLNNGTVSARYSKIWRTINFQAALVMGSTSTYGSGAWLFALPEQAASYGSNLGPTFQGFVFRSSTNTMIAIMGYLTTSTQMAFYVTGSGPLSNGTPFSFASGDQVHISGCYEAAA